MLSSGSSHRLREPKAPRAAAAVWYHTPNRPCNRASNAHLPLTLDAKKEWNEHFELYIRDLDTKKPVIWSGDLNVAPTALGEYFLFASVPTPSRGVRFAHGRCRTAQASSTRVSLYCCCAMWSSSMRPEDVSLPQQRACARSSFQAHPPARVIMSLALYPSFLAFSTHAYE